MYFFIAILGIVQFVVWIMVLIKLFKEKGWLHGIMGFFSCGLYPFIWGWKVHKELKLTKVMTIWTVAWVVYLVLLYFTGYYSAMWKIMKMTEEKDKIKSVEVREEEVVDEVPKEKVVTTTIKKVVSLGDQKKAAEWALKAQKLWENGKLTNPGEALNYLSLAISLNPNDAKIYNDHGIAYYKMAKYHQAIDDYNQAINLDSKFGTAYLNRGLAFYQLNDLDSMCRNFKKACEFGECSGIDWAKQEGNCM